MEYRDKHQMRLVSTVADQLSQHLEMDTIKVQQLIEKSIVTMREDQELLENVQELCRDLFGAD